MVSTAAAASALLQPYELQPPTTPSPASRFSRSCPANPSAIPLTLSPTSDAFSLRLSLFSAFCRTLYRYVSPIHICLILAFIVPLSVPHIACYPLARTFTDPWDSLTDWPDKKWPVHRLKHGRKSERKRARSLATLTLVFDDLANVDGLWE